MQREHMKNEELDSQQWELLQLKDQIEKLGNKVKEIEGAIKQIKARRERKALVIAGAISLLTLWIVYDLENL